MVWEGRSLCWLRWVRLGKRWGSQASLTFLSESQSFKCVPSPAAHIQARGTLAGWNQGYVMLQGSTEEGAMVCGECGSLFQSPQSSPPWADLPALHSVLWVPGSPPTYCSYTTAAGTCKLGGLMKIA